jgi:hypothetical protein
MQCTAGVGKRGANQGFSAVPNPESYERFPGLLTRGKFHFPAWKKVPLQSAENFFKLEKEK